MDIGKNIRRIDRIVRIAEPSVPSIDEEATSTYGTRPQMTQITRWGCLLFVAIMVHASGVFADELRLARFTADVTIPIGHRCMGVLPTKALRVDDPLLVHGWVLMGAGKPVVYVAFDWCEIRNKSYERWREVLSVAVGTTPENVLISSLHQHDAPVIDAGAQQLLDDVGLEKELYDPSFLEDCERRVCQAAMESLEKASPVTHVGVGRGKVEKVASNRRVVYPDGRVDYDRYSSSGADPFHSTTDDGLIDPWLTTISFWNEEKPLLAMSHYAVHPMSFYGRGGVSYDFVGIARERRWKATGIPQMYVSGCSGDVTAGKYNDGSVEKRLELAERLELAMGAAWKDTKKHACDRFEVRSTRVRLPFHEGQDFRVTELQSVLDDPGQTVETRILAAMGLESRRRWDEGATTVLPCLDLGIVSIVVLPGESFVGYQILAQQMRSDQTVVAVGYGDCWSGYVPTAQAFEEQFSHDWRWVGPGAEEVLRVGLGEVLRANTPTEDQTGVW